MESSKSLSRMNKGLKKKLVKEAVASIKEARACGLRLRPVRQKDCHLLWEWANDPVARAASFSSEFILWENHVRWFTTKLSDPNCHYYILLSEEGVPIGQVRFDISGNRAEINISIASGFRGHGYGTNGIRIASKRLFQEAAVARIYAHIKPSNNASIHAFMKAGYKMARIKVVRGHEALQMVLHKNKESFKDAPH